jgi:hypothetical protein
MVCQIEIGGQIFRTQRDPDEPEITMLEALIGAINDEGCCEEYGDKELLLETEADLLEHLDPDTGRLRFRHDQKPNGQFEQLEDWLQEHGIPFRRWSEAKYEYDAEEVIWLPDMSKPFHCIMDQECNEVVKGEAVREVMELLVAYQTEEPTRSDYLNEAIAKMRKLCPDVPEVPKFEILDQTA